MQNNPLDLVEQYIAETSVNIFLTGKAGTGKTTFLHNLQQHCAKRLVVAAPTGVAAINAKGVTLHSLFQLPFGPYIPGSTYAFENNRQRFRREKKNLIKNLDLLIIDEISMVRADMLDSVDNTLRRIRRNDLPFGGVQLLMIGDLYQLPPVVKPNDQAMLSGHYSSFYFFGSNALQKTDLRVVELTKVYRQSDETFITILNQIRNNSLTPQMLDVLNQRVETESTVPEKQRDAIILCTHNRAADDINKRKFDSIDEDDVTFEADVEGDFPETMYPVPYQLSLKKGAQVMFIKNDLSEEKSYFNGKTGVITWIDDGYIKVRCEDEPEITVTPVRWDNIEYTLNEKTQEIEETVNGSFKQYPLRYAWAITVHKSQGLTFSNAVIDVQAAFAHGQTYVALSRLRSLDGLTLKAPLSSRTVMVDQEIVRFSHESQKRKLSEKHLLEAKIGFQQQLLYSCFSFAKIKNTLARYVSSITAANIVKNVSDSDLHSMLSDATQEIFLVGGNFKAQLSSLFQPDTPPDEDAIVHERLQKSSVYFGEKIQHILLAKLDALSIETDNKEQNKKIKRLRKYVDEQLQEKCAAIASLKDGFSATTYFRAVAKAATESKAVKAVKKDATVYLEKDLEHPPLFEELKKWRKEKADQENVAHFQVMHQKTLVNIAAAMPEKSDELLRIRGIGPQKAEKYGDEIIEIIGRYLSKNGIEKEQKELEIEEEPAIPTRQQSLNLFNEGKTIEEIATLRGLTTRTVSKHLAFQIEEGNVDIKKLIDNRRLQHLLPLIKKHRQEKLRDIKDQLEDDVSYEEIQYILAHLKNTN